MEQEQNITPVAPVESLPELPPAPEPKNNNKAVFIIIAAIVGLAIIGFAVVMMLGGMNGSKTSERTDTKDSSTKNEPQLGPDGGDTDKKDSDNDPDKKDPDEKDPDEKDPDEDKKPVISSGKCEIPYFGSSMGDYEDGKLSNCIVPRGLILNLEENEGVRSSYVLVPHDDDSFYAPMKAAGVGSIVKEKSGYRVTLDDPESWVGSDNVSSANGSYYFSFSGGVAQAGFGFYGQALADTRVFFVLNNGQVWSASVHSIALNNPDLKLHKDISNVAAILTGMVFYFTDEDDGMGLGGSMPYAVTNDKQFYLMYD